MNHKRKGPKDTRAGCLMCKPHKSNGFKGMHESQTNQEKLARINEEEQINKQYKYHNGCILVNGQLYDA